MSIPTAPAASGAAPRSGVGAPAAAIRSSRPRAGRVPAACAPIARLMVDVALPHLDRPFDYLVPDTLDEQVHAGSRVRVRFAGRLVDGYVLERVESSEHAGRLAFLERVVGTVPVLTEQTAALFRAVADRWAGTFVDVARLGVPSRHATAETEVLAEVSAAAPVATRSPAVAAAGTAATGAAAGAGWGRYWAGPALLAAIADRRPARAVVSVLPGEDWPRRLAEAAASAHAAGRGALLLVPDARDLARLDVAMVELLGPGHHVALSADLGPAARYRRWLAVRLGRVRVVIGTRAAAYAPVAELGLLALWDDGDDLYDEPRAPYAHTRDVLALRSAQTGAALLLAGHARTAEAQALLESGWAHEVSASREELRRAAPLIRPVADDVELARDPAAAAARLPSLAWRTAQAALAAGAPVLVQVPRRGYLPSLACVRDRTPARCPHCAGPLALRSAHAIATCRWCGRPAGQWRCPTCGERRMRSMVVGAARTAEELGRAFPGVAVRASGGERVLDEVGAAPELVVATPGAEPVAPHGYGAALLLDGWALLSRADLRAGGETLRRWMNAAALVRPGGTVVLGAEASLPVVQALVRWDPGGFAARELSERTELGFSPATRMATVSGTSEAVAELLSGLKLPPGGQLLGSVALGEDRERALLRAPRASGAALAAALKSAAAARSARKAPEPVRIVLDPADLG